MRNQILTQKRSSQSESSKFAILTNELNRRFEMMDDCIDIKEKIEHIDHFTKQLCNTGYSWQQSREIIVSSLKGIKKKQKEEKNQVKRDIGQLRNQLKRE